MRVELLMPAESENCPNCVAPGGTLTLLTSMTRYYRCPRCQRSWQVTRGVGTDRECQAGGVPALRAAGGSEGLRTR
jgi:transposase-like protein